MPTNIFQPPSRIIEKYADVIVNFALGGGKGIKKNDVVIVQASESAKPLYAALLKAIWKAGGHVIPRYSPDNEPWFKFDRAFFELAEKHQLDFFPEKFMKGLVDDADHAIFILSETDMHSLQGIEPEKMMRRGVANKPYMEWRHKKETEGKFTWTIALYGTPAMAKEARLSLEAYWNEIIKACFLDAQHPIDEWKEIFKMLEGSKRKLNALPIKKMHVEGPDADLWITLGEKRQWMGGSGRNIPSFELFTTPDWRGTEGWIRFNQPLYRYGTLIESVELHFKKGKVVKSSAKKNENVLKSMIASSNADKVGEFSLTDRRFSRISKFMAETLYDENVGGKDGNTHIALGSGFHECYNGNAVRLSKKQWENLGFNDSSVHTDIVSTAPRTVTAVLKDGSEKVIYQDGQFIL
jgi:aminopeptidase